MVIEDKKLNISHDSYIGKREHNLDEYLIIQRDNKYFFIMIDGFCSTHTISIEVVKLIKKIRMYLQLIFDSDKVSELNDFLYYINNKKKLYVNKLNNYSLKLSVLIGCIQDNIFSVSHIGDCRLYINDQLYTQDDSKAWKKITKIFQKSNNEFIGSHCINHAQQHFLLKSIPNYLDKMPLISRFKIKKGDRIIICTDGFWTKHHNNIISNCLNTADAEYLDNSTFIQIIV